VGVSHGSESLEQFNNFGMLLMPHVATSPSLLRLFRPEPATRVHWSAIRGRIDLAKVAAALLGAPSTGGDDCSAWLWWHCPFHFDSTPSIRVVAGEPTWSCGGCGAGGDAAALVMRVKHVSFRDAVQWLDEEGAHTFSTPVVDGCQPGSSPVAGDESRRDSYVIVERTAITAFDSGRARALSGRAPWLR
jgi:DNA primase